MDEKFVALAAHDTFILLPTLITIPKYLQHTTPCYQSEVWLEYDNTLQSVMGA